jgi:hypothetical protein
MKHILINANCLDYLNGTPQVFCTIFSDPPDNIGLGYQTYKDKLPDHQYVDLLETWLHLFIHKAKTVWFSYNARWTFEVGRIVTEMVRRTSGLEAKPCVQTFTFGQHCHHDLGNNHRPLLRLRWSEAPLCPDAIRIPSWRQENGDKRADPRGRVPGDVAHFEYGERDTLPLPNWTTQDVERFLAKIDRRSETDCWEWTAGKRAGYGRFRVGEQLYVATRLMWRLTHGVDPIGQLVLHACDNPGCCNPNHLFIGTDDDNNRDKESKRRGNHPNGENNGLAKLTTEDVVRIYQSPDTPTCLARQYGVTEANIRAIKDRKTWRHVTGELAMSDVFNFPRVTGNSKQRRPWHPTQLNEGLIERCVRLTTPEGESVLDPFGGTGTTLRVCKRTGNPCTLIELDAGYCAKIAEEHGMVRSQYIHRAIWETE